MSSSVFEIIPQLPTYFSPDEAKRPKPTLTASSFLLRDPLGGFINELAWNRTYHLTEPLELDDALLRRTLRECGHYTSNICVLLWFFHDYIERCQRAAVRRDKRLRFTRRLNPVIRRSSWVGYLTNHLPGWSRQDEFLLDAQSYMLPIQIDKLFGDVRSFLSSIYQLTQVFTPPAFVKSLSNKERESFGPFADRYEVGKLQPLVWPLTLIEELVPWGQTVRSIRDSYVHHGKSSFAMPRFEKSKGTTRVYFDLHGFSKGPVQRDLPNALYATDNPNDLLDLELLVLYLTVPVFALGIALGQSLQQHHRQSVSGWKPLNNGFKSGRGRRLCTEHYAVAPSSSTRCTTLSPPSSNTK